MKVDSLSYEFEAKDIQNILGIDKNKLFYWVKTHRLLRPEIKEAYGTGTRARFSLKNLLELAVIKELINFGFDLSFIKKIKNNIDNYYTEKNIYNDLLTDEEFRERRNLYIYKKGTKIYLYLQEVEEDYDVDTKSLTIIPIPVPDGKEWDEDKYPKGPPGYVAVYLKIGRLAYDLLDKLKRS